MTLFLMRTEYTLIQHVKNRDIADRNGKWGTSKNWIKGEITGYFTTTSNRLLFTFYSCIPFVSRLWKPLLVRVLMFCIESIYPSFICCLSSLFTSIYCLIVAHNTGQQKREMMLHTVTIGNTQLQMSTMSIQSRGRELVQWN